MKATSLRAPPSSVAATPPPWFSWENQFGTPIHGVQPVTVPSAARPWPIRYRPAFFSAGLSTMRTIRSRWPWPSGGVTVTATPWFWWENQSGTGIHGVQPPLTVPSAARPRPTRNRPWFLPAGASTIATTRSWAPLPPRSARAMPAPWFWWENQSGTGIHGVQPPVTWPAVSRPRPTRNRPWFLPAGASTMATTRSWAPSPARLATATPPPSFSHENQSGTPMNWFGILTLLSLRAWESAEDGGEPQEVTDGDDRVAVGQPDAELGAPAALLVEVGAGVGAELADERLAHQPAAQLAQRVAVGADLRLLQQVVPEGRAVQEPAVAQGVVDHRVVVLLELPGAQHGHAHRLGYGLAGRHGQQVAAQQVAGGQALEDLPDLRGQARVVAPVGQVPQRRGQAGLDLSGGKVGG